MIGNICSLFSREKPLKRVRKTGSKILLKSCRKQPPNGPIYRAPKTSRYGPDRAVGRPPGRPPMVENPTVRAAVDRPVDRASGTESRLSAGRSARSIGAFPESKALWTVDRVGRPALQPTVACTSMHVGRPPGRPTSSVGRPSGRPAEARKHFLGLNMLTF